jgi:large subunit ribosomal protein L19
MIYQTLHQEILLKLTSKLKKGKNTVSQTFEGLVIKTQGSGISYAVCVRKSSNGVFVERTFPVNSPLVDSIEVVKRGRVRRARIYYIRKLSGKAARIKEIVTSRAEKLAKAEPKKATKKAAPKAEPKTTETK